MKAFKEVVKSFSKFEIGLWIFSLVAITASFFVAGKNANGWTLASSLFGATSLIFIAKGSVFGQAIGLIFGALYATVSYSYSYYGEMIIFFCMSLPVALLTIINWIRNPSSENANVVKVQSLNVKGWLILSALEIFVGIGGYFILKNFGTNNVIWSTISLLTSFAASYLSLRRSRFYAIAYTLNDIILIILWSLATVEDMGYLSMVICFVVFLFNDTYAFFNWTKLKHHQKISATNNSNIESFDNSSKNEDNVA